MSPILLVKCKTKIFTSVAMVLFGIACCAVSGFFLFQGLSYWWIIGILFGLFCIVTWINILRKGSMTLVFLVQNGILYFTYERTKVVLEHLDAIKAFEFFSNQYELGRIKNFWRHIQKLNGAVSTDILHIVYDGRQINLADLGMNEVELSEKQLKEIAIFLLSHQPSIAIGKP
jgi:hypothetical protein